MTAYVKTLSKRNEGEDKEKTLPVGYLGSSMISHGEDFENDSEFGQCLISKSFIRNVIEESLLMAAQTWVEQTSGLRESKKPT